jgi:hypothetical protein
MRKSEFYRAMRFLENYKHTNQAKNSDYLGLCSENPAGELPGNGACHSDWNARWFYKPIV